MIDDLINELQEYKTMKDKIKYLQKDKQKMSKLLYEYMMKEYNTKSYDERVNEFRNDVCKNCRNRDCGKELPIDILKPIESDKDFIPSKKGCSAFNWD